MNIMQLLRQQAANTDEDSSNTVKIQATGHFRWVLQLTPESLYVHYVCGVLVPVHDLITPVPFAR